MERQSGRGWLWLALTLAALAGIAALAIGLFRPLTIQDDARQFIFWMAEWRDENTFRGDLVADYWRSVSPWLYVVVFRVADFLALDPITTARLLPVILFPATAYFAYRFSEAICRDPRLACLSTILLLTWLVSDDSVVSSTPRAFAPLFLMMFLDGMARRSILEVAAGLFCLAGIYPNVAIVAATTLGIVLVDLGGRPRLALTRANLTLFAAGAVAALAGVAPLLVESGHFGPIVTPETATGFATFHPGGRSSLIGPDGAIDFACQSRIGVLPKLPGCDGWASPVFWLVVLAAALPPALVFRRYLKTGGRSGSPIPLAVVIAAFVWFTIGIAVAFKLHIPSRFVVRTVPMMTLLCLGLTVGTFLQNRLRPGTRSEFLATSVGGGLLLAGLAALVATVTSDDFRTWKHQALAGTVASYPVGTVFAGFVDDTDNIPVFTQRRVLFSSELAIAYHLGYYRQIEARMRDMAVAEFTPDAAVLAERLERNAVDVYLVDERRLADPDRKFDHLLGGFVEELKAGRGGAQTALSRLAGSCNRGTFDRIAVLDAHCLIAAARQ